MNATFAMNFLFFSGSIFLHRIALPGFPDRFA